MEQASQQNYNLAAFKRLVLAELIYNGAATPSSICGYDKKAIRQMCEYPHRCGRSLLRLSNYMYLQSGFFRRIVDYYVNMALYRWTVDTEIRNDAFEQVSAEKLKKSLFRFAGAVNALRLEDELSNILRRIYLNDACYGYIVESADEPFVHYFDPEICEINQQVNGNWNFRIRPTALKRRDRPTYPPELQALIQSARDGLGYVQIPPERSFCVKYFDLFPFAFPPFFHLIADILDVDDYKTLNKAKAEQEAYRLLAMSIPLDSDNQPALGENYVTAFSEIAKAVVPPSIGILPSPMKVEAIQFQSGEAKRDNVEDAIKQLMSEAGVSPAIAGGGTSGSEVRMGITADEGDLFRLYAKISKWINFHLRLNGKGVSGGAYTFSVRLLNITTFSEKDVIERELSLAQASLPNKLTLCASAGMNPARLFGNQFVENDILLLGDKWRPLQTSHTQSGGAKAGRPESPDSAIANVTETQRDNGSNKTENRL